VDALRLREQMAVRDIARKVPPAFTEFDESIVDHGCLERIAKFIIHPGDRDEREEPIGNTAVTTGDSSLPPPLPAG
jgi:hypothetical protein